MLMRCQETPTCTHLGDTYSCAPGMLLGGGFAFSEGVELGPGVVSVRGPAPRSVRDLVQPDSSLSRLARGAAFLRYRDAQEVAEFLRPVAPPAATGNSNPAPYPDSTWASHALSTTYGPFPSKNGVKFRLEPPPGEPGCLRLSAGRQAARWTPVRSVRPGTMRRRGSAGPALLNGSAGR